VLKSPNPAQETEKVITTFPFVIGRDDCDFNIPDQRISRRHIEITSQNGKFFITDLDSRNGTFLDTLKLPPNQPTPLNSATVVRLGQHTQLQLEP
jgi:predicted component of type VI protein secretion system